MTAAQMMPLDMVDRLLILLAWFFLLWGWAFFVAGLVWLIEAT